MRTLVRRLLVGLALAVVAHPARAQNTVNLEGSVKSNGVAVSGAQVTVVNSATHETLTATTRSNGEFRVIGLFPGQYGVTVKSVGYTPAGQSVQINIGQRARLEFALEKGAVELGTQQVTGNESRMWR